MCCIVCLWRYQGILIDLILASDGTWGFNFVKCGFGDDHHCSITFHVKFQYMYHAHTYIEFGAFYVHGQDIMLCSLVSPAQCISVWKKKKKKSSLVHESFEYYYYDFL